MGVPLPPRQDLVSHLHAGKSRKTGKRWTTAWQRYHQERRPTILALQPLLAHWLPPAPSAPRGWAQRWGAPQPRRTWPSSAPASAPSPLPAAECPPSSGPSTRPASTKPGGGRAASPSANLRWGWGGSTPAWPRGSPNLSPQAPPRCWRSRARRCCPTLTHVVDELLDFGLHPPVAELHLAELVGTHQGSAGRRLQPVVPQRAPARLGRVVELGVLLRLVFPGGDGVTHDIDGVCGESSARHPMGLSKGTREAGRRLGQKSGGNHTKISGASYFHNAQQPVANSLYPAVVTSKAPLGAPKNVPTLHGALILRPAEQCSAAARGTRGGGGRRGGGEACKEPGLTHIRALARRFGSWESGPGDPGGRGGWCRGQPDPAARRSDEPRQLPPPHPPPPDPRLPRKQGTEHSKTATRPGRSPRQAGGCDGNTALSPNGGGLPKTGGGCSRMAPRKNMIQQTLGSRLSPTLRKVSCSLVAPGQLPPA